MRVGDLLPFRLYNQRLAGARLERPEEVVTWLGAVQAQEYASAKWAIAERTTGTSDSDIDGVFARGRILRTHVMRPTWHFVPAADIKWMLALTAPRVHAMSRSRYRELKIDDRAIARSQAVIARALRGGRYLTRAELRVALQQAGVTSPVDDPQRLTFLVMRAELDALICSGPKVGAQFTYALLEERVPRGNALDPEAARGELARRYFRSHGPATLRDFIWWSGLTAAEARAGLDAVRSELLRTQIDGNDYWRPKGGPADGPGARAYLLTTYDECFVAYRDRPGVAPSRSPQHGLLAGQRIVAGGRVVGTWRRTVSRSTVLVEASAFSRFTRRQQDAIAAAVARYEAFLERRIELAFSKSAV